MWRALVTYTVPDCSTSSDAYVVTFNIGTLPMMAYRRPKNLRDQLTRASLTGPTRRGGFLNCTDSDCMIHHYTTPNNKFRSTVTGVTYPISRPLTCADNNVIYLVTCTKPDCRQQYTGETGRTFKDRTNRKLEFIL